MFKTFGEVFPNQTSFFDAISLNFNLIEYFEKSQFIFESLYLRFKSYYFNSYFKIKLNDNENEDKIKLFFIDNLAQTLPIFYDFLVQKSKVEYNSIHEVSYKSNQNTTSNNLTVDANHYSEATKAKKNIAEEYKLYNYKRDYLQDLVQAQKELTLFDERILRYGSLFI